MVLCHTDFPGRKALAMCTFQRETASMCLFLLVDVYACVRGFTSQRSGKPSHQDTYTSTTGLTLKWTLFLPHTPIARLKLLLQRSIDERGAVGNSTAL